MNSIKMLMNRIEKLMNLMKLKVITMTTSETLSWSKSDKKTLSLNSEQGILYKSKGANH